MPEPSTPASDRTAIALVYWGRLGAGAALMRQIGEAMATDERFDIYASPSRQSELMPALPADRVLEIETFSGPFSFLVRTIGLSVIIDQFVAELRARQVRAIATIMPHVWGRTLQRAAARAGIRTILMVHDAEPHPGERRPVFDGLVRREIRSSDRVVTLSDHVAARLLALGDATEERLVRLYHPIFRFGGGANSAVLGSPVRLLFFGRILPYKGVPLLLDAFARLHTAGAECVLRVVGRGRIDAPASLLNQPGLTIQQGWVAPDAIGSILARADAVVLPYLEASQSGVIAAAYGAGLPVVGTPVGGIVEQIADGETGVLAADVTADALAAAIRRLIETPGLLTACRAGVARYAEAHTPERFARALGDAVLTAIG